MGHARDRRRREEWKRVSGGGRGDPKLEVRRRVKRVLKTLGLLGAFEAMPAHVRDQFFDCCHPDPVLVFDPSFPSADVFGGAYAEIRDEVAFEFAHVSIKLSGFDLAVKDFLSIAIPIEAMVRRTVASIHSPLGSRPHMPTAVRAFLETADESLQFLCRPDVEGAMFNALHAAVVVPLVARSRLDGNLLHARLTNTQTPRGRRMTMTLYAEKPAMKYVRMHNGQSRGSRPMHRVGTANVWKGIEWASWSRAAVKGQWAELLGMGATDEWPVYVQEHALLRLRQRLDTYAHADWAQHWMYESLKHPKIVERTHGGDLMVAFEVQEKRLGYLVATVRNGTVVVRTFLFLTMRNTYEGRELAKRLKLTCDEMDYLRLHELSRFTRTDLKDDPQLRPIFKQCGCGHLFELAVDEHAMLPTARTVTPFAAELKQYVGVAA